MFKRPLAPRTLLLLEILEQPNINYQMVLLETATKAGTVLVFLHSTGIAGVAATSKRHVLLSSHRGPSAPLQTTSRSSLSLTCLVTRSRRRTSTPRASAISSTSSTFTSGASEASWRRGSSSSLPQRRGQPSQFQLGESRIHSELP